MFRKIFAINKLNRCNESLHFEVKKKDLDKWYSQQKAFQTDVGFFPVRFEELFGVCPESTFDNENHQGDLEVFGSVSLRWEHRLRSSKSTCNTVTSMQPCKSTRCVAKHGNLSLLEWKISRNRWDISCPDWIHLGNKLPFWILIFIQLFCNANWLHPTSLKTHLWKSTIMNIFETN